MNKAYVQLGEHKKLGSVVHTKPILLPLQLLHSTSSTVNYHRHCLVPIRSDHLSSMAGMAADGLVFVYLLISCNLRFDNHEVFFKELTQSTAINAERSFILALNVFNRCDAPCRLIPQRLSFDVLSHLCLSASDALNLLSGSKTNNLLIKSLASSEILHQSSSSNSYFPETIFLKTSF